MSDSHTQEGSQHSLDKKPVHENHAASAQAAPTSVEPVAPQDTQAAGAAEGEQRGLLHGNVSGSEQKGASEKAHDFAKEQPGGTAGVHSTGSHTGSSHGEKK